MAELLADLQQRLARDQEQQQLEGGMDALAAEEEAKGAKGRQPVNDGFHIRLVCTVLEVAHQKLESSAPLRRTLAAFLDSFQATVLRQAYVSMDLEFQILDTLELFRSKPRRYGELQEIQDISGEVLPSAAELEQPHPLQPGPIPGPLEAAEDIDS